MSRTAVINNKFIPSDFLPIGFLGYLPYSAVPAGWLVCDGTVYNIADYPELAAKLGSTYGGDGVTTFAVPDDRGLFRRGLDLGRGYDAGRALGSEQGDMVGPHDHAEKVALNSTGGSLTWTAAAATSGASGTATSTITTVQNSGTETRPKNRAYVPIIKAKNIYYDMTVQGGNAASLGGNPVSYYAPNSLAAKYTDFTGTFATNGYRRLPDGTIIQWGYDSSSSSPSAITFPVAFTYAVYSVSLVPVASNPYYCSVSQLNLTTFTIIKSTSFTDYWFAIGK